MVVENHKLPRVSVSLKVDNPFTWQKTKREFNHYWDNVGERLQKYPKRRF